MNYSEYCEFLEKVTLRSKWEYLTEKQRKDFTDFLLHCYENDSDINMDLLFDAFVFGVFSCNNLNNVEYPNKCGECVHYYDCNYVCVGGLDKNKTFHEVDGCPRFARTWKEVRIQEEERQNKLFEKNKQSKTCSDCVSFKLCISEGRTGPKATICKLFLERPWIPDPEVTEEDD